MEKNTPTHTKVTLPFNPRTILYGVKVNQLTLNLVNGAKSLTIGINITASAPTYYNFDYANLTLDVQGFYDGLISWAASVSGGVFPSIVPNPPDYDNPVVDSVVVQIVDGTKNSLSYIPNNSLSSTVTYISLSGTVKNNYDSISAWADTVDTRFLG